MTKHPAMLETNMTPWYGNERWAQKWAMSYAEFESEVAAERAVVNMFLSARFDLGEHGGDDGE